MPIRSAIATDVRGAEWRDGLLVAHGEAPIDDEPLTPEAERALAEAWREHRLGKGIVADDVKRRLVVLSAGGAGP